VDGRQEERKEAKVNLKRNGTRRWPILLAAVTGALCVVAVAGAANSGSFTDQGGDSGGAADITQVDVSNDDSGLITIRMDLAGQRLIGADDEAVAVVDLDQNPDTGSVYYGTEVAITLQGGGSVGFMRADGDRFAAAPPPASLQATSEPGFVTFTINAADLGVAPTGGFNVTAFSISGNGDDDLAPDIRTFNYQLVAGTPPPPLGPDTRAPVDRALRSVGVHGKVVPLLYTAQDGRAVTADTIRVYRRNRLIKTIRIRLGDSNPFYAYYASWHVPRKVRGRLRFCVRSVDVAGNKSNQSCARLVIR
jgi:hypothetical protein